MEFEAKIKGIAEVKRAIYAYNAKLGEKITRSALRQGANVTLKAIRQAAPVKTGRLKKAIKLKNSRRNRLRVNGKIGLYITINKGKSRKDVKGAWYGGFVENGYNHGSKLVSEKLSDADAIALHNYKKANGLRYRNNRIQTRIRSRRGGVHVPGKYFIRKAFNATKQQAANTIIQASEIAANRIARELGFKTT